MTIESDAMSWLGVWRIAWLSHGIGNGYDMCNGCYVPHFSGFIACFLCHAYVQR